MGIFSIGLSEPGEIESYSVTYIGGLESYPKGKAGMIDFKICEDRFVLLSTIGTKSWFNKLTIDYSQITSFEVVQRQVTAMEGLLGGLNAAHLNQPTNLNIQYKNETGADLLLRVGMLSGVTVMGQAVRCTELLDLLRVTGILSKFAKS